MDEQFHQFLHRPVFVFSNDSCSPGRAARAYCVVNFDEWSLHLSDHFFHNCAERIRARQQPILPALIAVPGPARRRRRRRGRIFRSPGRPPRRRRWSTLPARTAPPARARRRPIRPARTAARARARRRSIRPALTAAREQARRRLRSPGIMSRQPAPAARRRTILAIIRRTRARRRRSWRCRRSYRGR